MRLPATRYTRTAIALHWIVALMVLGNLAFGLYLVGLPLSPQKLRYFSWHKWIGVTVFALATVRLLWRLRHAAPELPASMPQWERRAANASHTLLYVLVFAAPLSGWLFSYKLNRAIVALLGAAVHDHRRGRRPERGAQGRRLEHPRVCSQA